MDTLFSYKNSLIFTRIVIFSNVENPFVGKNKEASKMTENSETFPVKVKRPDSKNFTE